MEYKNEQFGLSFSVPDKVTVRQQLAFYSEAARASGDELFERMWLGARTVIQDWKCTAMPDLNANIDELTDPDAAGAIVWASMRVKEHMDGLENIPKN